MKKTVLVSDLSGSEIPDGKARPSRSPFVMRAGDIVST